MSAEVLAILPARGGSKGIPRKNIRPLAGKPLLGWSLDALRSSRTVTRRVVSTDDEEIAGVARRLGADVVMRPAEISGDRASSEAALLHVLTVLSETEGYRPDVLAFLQCTSPFVTTEDIDGTVKLVQGGEFDSAVTAVPFHHFLWKKQGETCVGINHDASRRPMRQERGEEFMEVGAVYAMNAVAFQRHRHRFFGRIGLCPISPLRALEIDNPDDWDLAEALAQRAGGRLPAAAAEKLKKIRLVVTDFDGVLTDNRVLASDDGSESVLCSRGDGWAVNLLKKRGIEVICLSSEVSEVVARRCAKMGIECRSGLKEKAPVLRAMAVERGLELESILYVGNDTNDGECLRIAGVAVVPADAAPAVMHLADKVTQSGGGAGVLREVAGWFDTSSEG